MDAFWEREDLEKVSNIQFRLLRQPIHWKQQKNKNFEVMMAEVLSNDEALIVAIKCLDMVSFQTISRPVQICSSSLKKKIHNKQSKPQHSDENIQKECQVMEAINRLNNRNLVRFLECIQEDENDVY